RGLGIAEVGTAEETGDGEQPDQACGPGAHGSPSTWGGSVGAANGVMGVRSRVMQEPGRAPGAGAARRSALRTRNWAVPGRGRPARRGPAVVAPAQRPGSIWGGTGD